MGLLSNFIGGAAQAGGEILQRERESGVRVKESQDIARFNDELMTRREQALAALREQYQIAAEGRQVAARRDEESYQASPERIAQLTTADRAKNEGIIGNRIALAPKTAEAAAAEFAAGADTRKAAQAEKITFALDEYRQKTAAELESEIKKLNDPKYLQGKAREAAAGRDPNSAALHRVQLESAQLALMEKKTEAKIPPAVKGSIASIQEQAKAISAAITKAELDGTASPEAVQKYQTRLSELNGQIARLYAPYLSERDRASIAPTSQNPPPPPDGTRGSVDGVPGTVINGKFVPDGAKPKPSSKQEKPASKALPKSFDEIPGVEDASTKVSSGVGLLSPERARLYANR